MTISIFEKSEKYLLIADLGQLRVLRFRPAGDDPAEKDHLEELKRDALDKPVQSVGEVTTDQAGKFGRGSGAGDGTAMSQGEAHNLASELERKTLEGLSACICGVLKKASHPQWILAAPQETLNRLEAALASCCRERLVESIGADLTKEPLAKLEGRFL